MSSLRAEGDSTDFSGVFGTEHASPQDIDWAAVEAALGTALPADYRAYADTYPALYLDKLITIRHPLAVSEWAKLVEGAKPVLESFAYGRSQVPDAVPYPLFPEPGGLLPWGYDDDGADYFWRTAGSPDEWTVLVFDSGEWWEFPRGFGALWIEWAGGRITTAPLGREDVLLPGFSVERVGD
ncbi:SMI1/KNR4 family protein [Amycolatopsis sp. DSM 110486]|uniref:SMI1/KNR4 family protein n=1 Tax=Amycolatopsis sp. DSM 110486 TaxID=2865832 RepID=UPI001C69ECF4|nr:SMI1/KNR4 family protein [Amycolatopsis sp. DSM 110486]QYN24408.1 SMI1/KNR4 family protein [Amycolatopsis sp. DSM 110486]